MVENEKKLFLLDAYALIYRAYYALIRAPRVTSKGLNTSAVFGFVNALDDVLKKEQPTHIAVCFDPKGGHTFRHELYPEYKAQRDAQPEDITIAVPYIKEILAGYRIPVIEMARYEADDIIGTLARRAGGEGFTTYMMTPDKDYGQLVDEHTYMYRPALKGKDFEVRGVAQVCERYGISRPTQVIDLLALEGDASDNIPGCPGVGEVTAIKLIREWDNIDNMLENVGQIKGALGRKIADNAAQILFSRTLVTIDTHVPIDVDLESLRRVEPDTERLRKVFGELEFRSFLAKLGDEAGTKAVKPSVPAGESRQLSLFDVPGEDADESADVVEATIDMSVEVEVTDDTARAEEVVAKACGRQYVGVATYAVGEEAMTAELRGYAIACGGEQVTYVDLGFEPERRQALIAALGRLTADADVTVVSADVKRDMVILKNLGLEYKCRYYDVSVAHYLLQPEMRHRLSDIAQAYAGYAMRMSGDAKRKPYGAYPDGEAAAIIGEEAAVALALRPLLTDRLIQEGEMELFDDIETPFVEVLASMERTGVRIDVAELNALSRQLTGRLHEMEQRCYELAGRAFNVSSPRQVGDVLFDELRIDPTAKRSKSGAYSTTEEILEKYSADHEIVGIILKIRRLTKLLGTYINALPTLINPATGKIHTTYNQTVTATGRISSTNPNLQNIPVRTDDGREIRRAFIPDEGCVMLAADYSQIELRLMADLSGDPDMVGAFTSGEDIHRATAAKIYKVPLEEVTSDMRRNAKTANFGIIYGISAFGLASRLSIPRSEAKMLIDGYFETYPHIRDYISGAIDGARDKGYVSTIMGRKRYLPDINSRNAVVRSYAERNAVNAPLQGSAADIIKKAMIDIFREMRRRGMRSRMIMQVHDELVFNVVPEELGDLQSMVLELMEHAYSGRVNLEVASGVGANWLDAK